MTHNARAMSPAGREFAAARPARHARFLVQLDKASPRPMINSGLNLDGTPITHPSTTIREQG